MISLAAELRWTPPPPLVPWVAEVERLLVAGDAAAVRGTCASMAIRRGIQRILRDGRPYLERSTLDDLGRGRERIYLHRFVAGDAPGLFHSHPWRASRSVILAGGYVEHRHDGSVKRVLPGQLNIIGAFDFHRVELLEADVWTIFNTGAPKATPDWHFLEATTGRRVHHLDARR